VFAAHSAIDWDWQVPGLMFPLGTLAAALWFAPHPGVTQAERRGAQAVAALIGIMAVVWSLHMWEATKLSEDANQMVETAKVLGWTPARSEYVLERLQEAEWLNPSPLPATYRSIALFEMGRLEEATSVALKVARENPNWWFGWTLVWKSQQFINPKAAERAYQRGAYLRGRATPEDQPAR
jgi:hypothetical protein